MSNSMNVQEMQDRRTRERIERDVWARREAIAEFPLRVAQMAADLKQSLKYSSHYANDREWESYIETLEKLICAEYRKLFGREMGQ